MNYNNCMNKKIINNILCNLPCRFPINNSHYVTGKNMFIFSKLMCVEKELSNIGYYCNNICSNIKHKFR